MRFGCYLLLLFTLLAGPELAWAQGLGIGMSIDRSGRGSNYVPPLDVVTVPGAAYSLRKLRAAYGGPAVQLRRASDSTVQDIGFVGTNLDIAAATSFCNATSCFVAKWYHQGGGGLDVVQATAASQPAFIFNCVAGMPCLRTTAAGELASATSVTPTAPQSFAMVANRSAGAQLVIPISNANNYLYIVSGSAQWANGSATHVFVPATDNAWHGAATTTNAASSAVLVDGTEVAGTADTNGAAGPVKAAIGASATTVSVTEAVFWNGYALTPAERTTMVNSQRAYWGF